MAESRKPRVPMSEQIKLINECRKSGMTDADWCRANQIAPSTFYNWISRSRKTASGQIQEPAYGHTSTPKPRQDVVPVKIIPDLHSETVDASHPVMTDMHLDNSHTIEVVMKDLTIRISNDADPVLLTRILRLLQETLC